MMSADLPSPLPPAARSRAIRRDRLVLGALALLAALGLWGLARATDWRDIWAKLQDLTLIEGAVLLGLSLVNYGLRSLRWHLFARALGLGLAPLTSALHYFGGFAMSVTPGKIGELVRVRWLAAAAGAPLIRAAPAALADRAADLAAMAILLAACLSFAVEIRGAWAIAFLALGAAFVATHPRLLEQAVLAAYRLSGRRLPRLTARLRRAARSLTALAEGGVLIPSLALGMAGWAAEGYAFHLLLVWFGADIGFATALAIFIFATLAGGLTGAPGGLGGAEAAMVALLTLRGADLETAVAATVIIRATTLWFAVVIGLAAFPFAERQAGGGQR